MMEFVYVCSRGEARVVTASKGLLLFEHKLSGIESVHVNVIDDGFRLHSGCRFVAISSSQVKRLVFTQELPDPFLGVAIEVLPQNVL
jgi:hypothetical protein